jgi:hypothetical protein
MPSTLTHWRIAIEALHQLPQDPLRQFSAPQLRLPACSPAEPGHDIPILTYVGAVGPDLAYNAGVTTRSAFFPSKQQRATRGKSAIADLLHYNKTGEFLIELLRSSRAVASPELRQKIFYYALGHATHIAGDIMVHPYTNTFAGAFHDQSNPAIFNNLGIHFAIEFCHDMATDRQYFHAKSNALRPRPWLRYLAGARAELTQRHEGVSLLDILAKTTCALYALPPTQATEVGDIYLSGLRGMQTLLGWFRYYPVVNPLTHLAPRLSTYFMKREIAVVDGSAPHIITFEQAVTAAIQVGARFGTLLTNYFADITVGLPDDGDAYRCLRHDLRDWNLDTGYYWDQQWSHAERPSPIITMHHSWNHFLSPQGTS